MTILLISAMTFVAVSALIGLLAFVFVDRSGGTRMVDRLETLTGRRRKESAQANMIKPASKPPVCRQPPRARSAICATIRVASMMSMSG